MSLPNVAYQAVLGWANTQTRRLEAQALIPMLGETPVELGLAGREDGDAESPAGRRPVPVPVPRSRSRTTRPRSR